MKALTTTILLANLFVAQVLPCQADGVVNEARLAVSATVEDIVDSAQSLSGRIVNHSAARLENVRLLVSYGWLWNDDRRTDDASPGWTEYHTLSLVIAAGQSGEFSVAHVRSRPARDDGQLTTTVQVVGFTEVTSR